MADNGLLYTAIALLFGAVTVLIPTFSGQLGLTSVSVILIQVSSLALAGFSISRIFYSRNQNGLDKMFSTGILIVTGFLLVGTLGQATITDYQEITYTFSSEFSENGTIGPNMEENVDTQLQFNSDFTGTAPTSGQYTSDRISGEGDITFDQIVVELSDFDETVHDANLTVQTVGSNSTAFTETTFSLSEGTNYLNVSQVNTAIDTEGFEFEYDVTTQETNRERPYLDYFTFDTTQETTTETGEYGIVSLLAGVIFILGGIGVLFS